jgi:cold shock protein
MFTQNKIENAHDAASWVQAAPGRVRRDPVVHLTRTANVIRVEFRHYEQTVNLFRSRALRLLLSRRVSSNFIWDAAMAEGTIKKITDKGFGFIETGRGGDLFFHMSNVEGVRFDDLREGQRVSYNEGRGPKGPRAENVRPI